MGRNSPAEAKEAFGRTAWQTTWNGRQGICQNEERIGKQERLPVYISGQPSGNVIQAKVYVDRKHSIDFDWGHEHRNKGAGSDNRVFPKGVVHVQSYSQTNSRNSNQARYMTDSEISKYGAILKHFDPNVKFRP